MNRRRFVTYVAGALPPLVLARRLAQQPPIHRLLQLNGYAIDAETPLELLTDYLTPNELFFVRHHWTPALPDRGTWRLVVDGEVARPLALSLPELKRLPASSVTCVLQCAGNGRGLQQPPVPGVQWGQGAVGNARWTGVRVKELLNRAGVRGSARHLHTFGSDTPPGRVPPFHRSLELDKALEDGIVAYAMNGESLPPLHGAPARLVVPGWAGDHWMKWLTRLSAQPEPQQGFYMDVAYRYPKSPGQPGVTFKPEEMTPVTELLVKSVCVAAPARVSLGARAILRGFAFSGAPDIARVELSDDDGVTWHPARLDARHDPYAWRRWSYAWTASRPGRTRILTRATDSRGTTQPRDPVWNQSGYLSNGWHTVEIEVVQPGAAPAAPETPTALPALGTRIEPLPEGPGRDVAERSCVACHSADLLRQQRLTERQWSASLTKMKGWGAELTDEAGSRLLAYLVEHFGPGNDRFRPLATRPARR